MTGSCMDGLRLAFFIVSISLMAVLPSAAAGNLPGAAGMQCSQVNSSYIACYDGVPIGISFSIGAPYSSVFGPFTVTQVDYANVSEPLDVFGSQCTVQSGQTVSCFATLKAIPLSAGNGTVRRTIRLQLKSQPYPQLVFNKSINMTIYHYLTHNESVFLDVFNSASSRYAQYNATYNYLCNGFGLCSSSVAYGLSVSGAYLALASANIDAGLTAQAVYNASIANRTLAGVGGLYAAYLNDSNRVMNSVIRSRYVLERARNAYQHYESSLFNCSIGSTTYGKNILTQISEAESYPMQTTVNGSGRYSQLIANISSYTDNAIGHCGTNLGKLPGSISLGSFSKNALYIIAAIAAAIAALFLILRFRSSKEVEKIRQEIEEKVEEMHKEKKEEEKKGEGGHPAGQETGDEGKAE